MRTQEDGRVGCFKYCVNKISIGKTTRQYRIKHELQLPKTRTTLWLLLAIEFSRTKNNKSKILFGSADTNLHNSELNLSIPTLPFLLNNSNSNASIDLN